MPLVSSKKFDQGSTQQFESERHMFDSHLSVQLPLVSAHHHVSQKPLLQQDTTKELNSISKIPLNIGGLDDILFVSTLTRVQSSTKKPMTSPEMKRQSSQQYMSSGPIYYATRRLSQPETQHHYYSCSSSSSSSNSSERQTSIHSDVAVSAELIRRFSSGSTTSTVATSISSAASLPTLVDAQTTGDKMKLINQLVIHPNEQETIASNIPNQQQLGHDPGHACDTMHSPYTLQHNNKSKEEIDEAHHNSVAPVWADPVKVKENPTSYEEVKTYLRENQISVASTLPLLKPCTFYFSDTNIKQQCYISAVNSVFQCDTVWQFSSRWRLYKQTYSKKPSQLLPNQNIFCFINGVEPMWEDKVNEKGGRLTITIQNNCKQLDDVFEWILCSFIGGGIFDNGVVGIVVSKRNRGDRIELWLDESNSTNQRISQFK